MARVETKTAPRRKTAVEALPFTRANYRILGVGLLTIVLGYVALAQDPWNGTMPLVVAPILLVVGYCMIIPLGILYRGRTVNAEKVPAGN
jgi:hypothetical protein